MKTERLIDMLSTNLEPANTRAVRSALVWAVAAGAVAAFCVMFGTVSLRTDLTDRDSLGFFVVKVMFALALTAAGLAVLDRAVRPGADATRRLQLVALPFFLISVAALAEWALGIATEPHRMTAGTHWLLCLYCIPLFAIVPFVLLVWALRRGAPTHLARTGAMAGLVAGAVGAAAYAFHCPDDSLPFIAVWYGLSIAFCAGVGALLGPRILRW